MIGIYIETLLARTLTIHIHNKSIFFFLTSNSLGPGLKPGLHDPFEMTYLYQSFFCIYTISLLCHYFSVACFHLRTETTERPDQNTPKPKCLADKTDDASTH